MVIKITNKKLLKVFNSLKDEEVKAVLLKTGVDLCNVKFLREHEKTFRSIIPDYFDKFKDEYRNFGFDGERIIYAVGRENFIIYSCLQHGIIDPDDFTSVLEFDSVGLSYEGCLSLFFELSSVDIFREGVLKLKDGDKKLVDFIDKNPKYLYYFLPLMCSIDSEVFSKALAGYLLSAGPEDTIRARVLREILQASDGKLLSRCLDAIDSNNFYRHKAMNEACVLYGDYVAALPPKDTVAVLRDAIDGEVDKYLDTSFTKAYHFIKSYKKIHQGEFNDFLLKVLKGGGNRTRWALLYLLTQQEVNGEYAKDIFSSKLAIEDLSFFINRLRGNLIRKEEIPAVFDKLFGILSCMDKVNYHFKTDDDINFARDVTKSMVVSALADVGVQVEDDRYVRQLDALYDTLKEEAQVNYLRIVGDRTSLDKRACLVKLIRSDNYIVEKYYDKQKIKLTYDEAVLVSDFLKTKKHNIKSRIIKEYLASSDSEKIEAYLLSCKEDYKISAGEEMSKSRGKVDSEKLEKSHRTFYTTIYGQESVFTVDKPEGELKSIAEQNVDVKPLPIIDGKRLKAFFETVGKFIYEHRDYEYQSCYDEGLAHYGSRFLRLKDAESGDNRWEAYPLGRELKAEIEKFTKQEIAGVIALMDCVRQEAKDLYLGIYGKSRKAENNYDYVRAFKKGYYFDTNEFNVLRAFEDAMTMLLDEELLLSLVAAFASNGALDKYNSLCAYPASFSKLLIKDSVDVELIKKVLHFESIVADKLEKYAFDLELIVKSYEYGLISDELARYFILKRGFLSSLLVPSRSTCVLRPDYKYPKFKSLLLDFVDSALDVEFSRGSLETPYSIMIVGGQRFYGAEKYIKAIAALRGMTWVRSPRGTEKNGVFSYILKCCVKAEGDSYNSFVELIDKYKITDDELLKATLFNPEFVDYTAQYLNIHNLKLAVFWFIAHLNEELVGDKQERRIEQIKEFSDISYPDFRDGAFDCKWYEEMVEKVPQEILLRVYDYAKYVTVGGLHKRAQRFFDALNGRISKAECLEKMSGTRNKDYCLIYSLIPIESREDLLERYKILSEFIRSGKQFGAQRQLSERRTVDIALENLSRAAGYSSPDIFIFEMEAETPSDIFKTYTIDNIEITPYIDGSKFKVAYTVKRDGKSVSSIPSKYGKDKIVVELKESVKQLNRKFRRIIDSLEKAMNNNVEFTVEQLKSMRREHIIASVLDKLVLLSGGRLCLFDGTLKDIDGNILTGDSVVVAHPVELKKLGLLQKAIEYVAKNNIRQPFKQVLREIYTKTDLELEQDEVLRFKGFEVDLKKCIAALKGKGWGVCEEIGLRKIYYSADVVAAIFREFDLFYTADFANVNRELHGVFFLKRKSGEIVPIKDVDDVTFSETLRDVDLMISISSKVIYDFDLAMSTVEMRHEVLKSIVSILGLSNVSFLKDNIKVEGKLGTYIINIRTGLVFKEGKGNLALKTIYSVDKPLLLDFVDEDPMTADIISKAVVLADDERIKDPSILREISD